MDSGRMPACVIDTSLGGGNNTSGCEVLIGRDATNYYPSMQDTHIKIGNRCGHDKNNLRQFIPPPNYKKRPHVIEEALRRLKEIETEPNKYGNVIPLFFHPADKGGRKRRSERLEASKRVVLAAIITTLNLQAMAVGYYDNRNEFHYFDYKKLLSLTGLTLTRLKRAMKDLQDIDLLKVFTTREKTPQGRWRTKLVKIELTDKIFEMLHLIDDFLRDRETSAIKFHEKQSRLDKKQKKLEVYRKPAYSSSRSGKTQKIGATLSPERQTSGLQSLVTKLTKPVPKVVKGRGYEIKARMEQLKYQGYEPTQIIDILKREFPPPS